MRKLLAAALASLLATPSWAAVQGRQGGAAVPSIGALGSPLQGPAALQPGLNGTTAVPDLPSSSIAVPGMKDEPQTPAATPQPPAPDTPSPSEPVKTAAPSAAAGLAAVWERAGLPAFSAGRLATLWEQRMPAGGKGIFHDQDYALKVAELSERLIGSQPAMSPRRRAAMLLAAAFHAADPKRAGPAIPLASAAAEAFEDGSLNSALAGTDVSVSEVAALIRAMELGPSGETGRKAASDAFAESERAWLESAIHVLGFARRIAPYLDGPSASVERLRALATETRATASPGLGRAVDQPSDDGFVKAGHSMLGPLKHSKLFAALPDAWRGGFEATLATLQYAREDPGFRLEANASPRGPPVYSVDAESALERARERAELLQEPSEEQSAADARGAARYTREIAGGTKLTLRQSNALVESFMEEHGIERDSARGRALLMRVLPQQYDRQRKEMLGLDPRLSEHAGLIMQAAEMYETTPLAIGQALKEEGFLESFLTPLPREIREATISRALLKKALARAVKDYPDNEQGRLLRETARSLTSPGGKSIEEIKRDGIFLYVNFAGGGVARATVGRDPDPSWPDMLFYVRFEQNHWRIGGYRQNHSARFRGGADPIFESRVRQWLIGGGIPKEHFEPRRDSEEPAAAAAPRPWAMTRRQWLAAGSPDLGIRWRAGARAETPPPWEDSLDAEIRAINDFLSLFPDPIAAFRRGGPADPARAEPERERAFGQAEWWHQHMTHFPGFAAKGLEDARETIIVGRKLGYRDEDILYQLVRNHVLGAAHPQLVDRARDLGWERDREAFRGLKIPADIKARYPALGGSETF